MDIRKYLVQKDEKVKLENYGTAEKNKIGDEELVEKRMPERVERLKELHTKLHAQEEKGIVVVLQAMDAAGKDEAITYLFSNLTAQGLKTTSFKKRQRTNSSMIIYGVSKKGFLKEGRSESSTALITKKSLLRESMIYWRKLHCRMN